MILNLLRVEALRVTDMMRRSFSENHRDTPVTCARRTRSIDADEEERPPPRSSVWSRRSSLVDPREEDQPAEADGVYSASSGHRRPAVGHVALLPHGDGAANHHRGPPGTRTHTHTQQIYSHSFNLNISSLLSPASARYSGVRQRAESCVCGSSCVGEQQAASQRPGSYPTGKCVCVCVFFHGGLMSSSR